MPPTHATPPSSATPSIRALLHLHQGGAGVASPTRLGRRGLRAAYDMAPRLGLALLLGLVLWGLVLFAGFLLVGLLAGG